MSWPGCGSAEAHDICLYVGYVYYNGPPNLVLDQSCNTLFDPVAPVPTQGPIAAGEETLLFDPTRGHEIWTNGSAVAVNDDVNALKLAAGGSIGRAGNDTAAAAIARFRGDIAEIVVYDTALENTERLAVESYLKNQWKY
jgi:hypothetical protein